MSAPPARRQGPVWAAVLLLFVGSIAIRWPGVAMYDSVSQYQQALEGAYTDWHPPIMARTWALLSRLHGGTEPFFLLQMLLWWGGLGLLAAALARRGRASAAGCVLVLGASPLMLGWATVVLKDAQMAVCLVAATGIAAHFQLGRGRIPGPAAAAILALIGYAALVRANAAFACAPFALAVFGWCGLRRPAARAAAALLGVAAVLLVSPLVNHRLLGAEAAHAERSLPVYDLAGIAHVARLPAPPGLARADWQRAERAGCYTPFFWNPYGEPDQCADVGEALAGQPGLVRAWIGSVATHPLAYAAHRLGHLNANLRLWADFGERDAVPPLHSEPNEFGLGAPSGPAARALIDAAWWQSALPIGWPAVWLAVSLGLLWAGRRDGDAQARLAGALALSAATMSASYAVVSIASDLRYHLWSMVAAALATILAIDARSLEARRSRIAAIVVTVVALTGSLARLGLAAPVYTPLPAHVPPPPAADPE